MQTFLPYPNFAVSAMCLDRARLGKQRVEARQIQTAVQKLDGLIPSDGPIGWGNHPAVTMWRGHVLALMLYGDCMIREWVRRGYENTMPLMLARTTDDQVAIPAGLVMPAWLGREDIHASHRSRLLMKDPEWYSQFGWTEEPGAEYVWP